jgi:hypothetical protein
MSPQQADCGQVTGPQFVGTLQKQLRFVKPNRVDRLLGTS